MESDDEVARMLSCESSESTSSHTNLTTGSDGSISSKSNCGTQTSYSSLSDETGIEHGNGNGLENENGHDNGNGNGNTSEHPTQGVAEDSASSSDAPFKDWKDWNFGEDFKRDPSGFLDEIVENCVHLNRVVTLKSDMAKRAVERSNIDRQLLLQEQKLSSDLRQELDDYKQRLESASINCHNLATENHSLMQELDQTREQFNEERSMELSKHNGIISVFRKELVQCQKKYAALKAEKQRLVAELNECKSKAQAVPEGGDGCGSAQKWEILCAALKGQLEYNQGVIQELQDKNEELEMRAADGLQSTDATDKHAKLQESFKLELAKQQTDGTDGGQNPGKTGKLNSLLEKMMYFVHKLSATAVSDHSLGRRLSRVSSSVSMSQIIGRNHLKMDPDEVLEDVFKAFCDMTTDYWVTRMHPIESVEPSRYSLNDEKRFGTRQ